MPHFTSSDGAAIEFQRSGEGPAVIVVDGAFSHPAINLTAVTLAQRLAPRFTVYLYARRGRGLSGDVRPYAVEREVEDIDGLIAVAGGAACVMGGSSGAVLALTAAAAGLAIPRLALYEPPFIVDHSRPPLPRDYLERLTALVDAGRRGDAVEYFMTAAVGLPAEVVTGARESPMWPELEAVAHTLPYDGAIMGDTMYGDPSPLRRWEAMAVPTLVMNGGASPRFLQAAAAALAGVLPNAERRTLAGQTHDVTADALAPALAEFFAQPA